MKIRFLLYLLKLLNSTVFAADLALVNHVQKVAKSHSENSVLVTGTTSSIEQENRADHGGNLVPSGGSKENSVVGRERDTGGLRSLRQPIPVPSKTSTTNSTSHESLLILDPLASSTLLALGHSNSRSSTNTLSTKTAISPLITSFSSIDRSKSRFHSSTLPALSTPTQEVLPSSFPVSNGSSADSGDFGTSHSDNPNPEDNKRSAERPNNEESNSSRLSSSLNEAAADKLASGLSAAVVDSPVPSSFNSLVSSASAVNNENTNLRNPTTSSSFDANRDARGVSGRSGDAKVPQSGSSFGLPDYSDTSSSINSSGSNSNNTATYVIIAGTGCLFLAGVAGLALYEKKSGRFSSGKSAAADYKNNGDGGEKDLSSISCTSSYKTARNSPSFYSQDDLEYGGGLFDDGEEEEDDRLFHMPPLGPISAYSDEDRRLIYKELHRTSLVESILEPGVAYVPGRLLYSANSVAACAVSKSGSSQESQVSWSDAFMEDLTGFESDSVRRPESVMFDDDSDGSEDIKHLTHYTDIKNLIES